MFMATLRISVNFALRISHIYIIVCVNSDAQHIYIGNIYLIYRHAHVCTRGVHMLPETSQV